MTRAGTVNQPSFATGWIWLLVFLIAIAFLESVRSGPDMPTERMVTYSILMIVGTAALTRICRVQKKFDPFEPVHLAFALFLVFYPIRALFAVFLDESWFDPNQRGPWIGLSAALLGYICFALGYKFGQRSSIGLHRNWLDREWDPQKATLVSLIFLACGLAGYAVMISFGESLFYFITLDPEVKSPEAISPWFYYLLWVCLLIQMGALIQVGIWLKTGKKKVWTASYCLLAMASTFFLSRYFTVLFLMMLALCWHYKKSKIRLSQVAMLLGLLVIYLGAAGVYREWISPGHTLEETKDLAEVAGQQDGLVLRYVVANLEELGNLCDVIQMAPRDLPYQIGSTFTPILLKPIPRAIMASKPLGASALFTQQTSPAAYDNGLVTALGAWGEWYLNFSWLGLILGMALTGAANGVAYRALWATNEFGRILLYLSLLVVLFSWLRNDFNAATTYGLYYFLPAIVALMIITVPEWKSPTKIGNGHAI
ncbi:MAG TPA: hypothetical protein VMJ35_08145 [Dongiaceae bacterium]|nr:hypothetical protein [Dongiaceae bacterium]